MRLAPICLALLLVLLAAPVSAGTPIDGALDAVAAQAGAERDVGLIVAIEDYGKAPAVPGARANARLWRQWMRARGMRDVRVVEDDAASHGWGRDGTPLGLLPRVEDAARQAKRNGGRLWFVFIGHGAPVAKNGSARGVLLAHGVRQTADSLETHGIFIESDLMPRLAKAGDAVAILDACFSGQAGDGARLVPGLQPLIPSKPIAPAGVTVFTAAKDTQFAGPLPGTKQPAFSYLMVGALAGLADGEVDRKRDGAVTSDEAYEWVKLQMAQRINGRRQTPTVYGPKRVLSRGEPLSAATRRAAEAERVPVAPTAAALASKAPPAVASPSAFVRRKLEYQTRYRPAMMAVPAGSYLMGSPESEAGRETWEKQRQVAVAAFTMMSTEVTQGHFRAVMGYNPSANRECGKLCPVENLTWRDAVRFANALARKEGRQPCYRLGSKVTQVTGCTGYRLPTTAEWEYAARAGTTGARYGRLRSIARFAGNGPSRADRVGHREPNRLGLHDMLGNVAEWCWDGFDPKALDSSEATAGMPVMREARGGHFMSRSDRVRAAATMSYPSDVRQPLLGFRLVRSTP